MTSANEPAKSLSRSREEALLRVVAAQRDVYAGTEPEVADAVASPLLACLRYAMASLGDKRHLYHTEGSTKDILESNDISFREVKTPVDLLVSTRALLLTFDGVDGRAMVVHRNGGRAVVFDPQSNPNCQPLRADQKFKPYAFELYASWPQPILSGLQLVGFFFHGHRSALLAVVFSSLLLAVLNLSIPTLTGYLVGTVLPAGNLRLIAETGLLVLLIALSTTTAQFFNSLALVRMENLVNLRVESALWNHLLRLPLPFFSRLGTADLIGRVASIRQMRQLISNGLLSTALTLIFSLTNLVLMLGYQTQLTLVAAAFSLVNAFLIGLLVWRSSLLEGALQEGQAEVSNLGLQAINGMPQVRVGGNEPFVFERWYREVARLASVQRQGEEYSNALEILGRVLNPVGQALIFGVFVYLLNQSKAQASIAPAQVQGDMNDLGVNQLVASFVAFQAAYFSFNSQLAALATQLANSVAKLMVLWRRSKVVMFASSEENIDHAKRQHTLGGDFSIQDLSFTYPGSADPILRNINLLIRPGSYTAITGPSGCGKSTLLRCLLRLVEYDAGLILADGIDIRELALRAYRRQFGVVLQNTPLQSGSIYEIVRAGRSYSRNEVWHALNIAGMADTVQAMPMQLETIISDGGSAVSGGQRQRLALARALLGQPKVLLLDEATSALDASTQSFITKTLEMLPITRIAIAHRISTIKSADQIAVIRNGVVSELGTYHELTSLTSGYLSRNRLIPEG